MAGSSSSRWQLEPVPGRPYAFYISSLVRTGLVRVGGHWGGWMGGVARGCLLDGVMPDTPTHLASLAQPPLAIAHTRCPSFHSTQ